MEALLHPRRPRPGSQTAGMRTRRPRPAPAPRSAFAGFRFPPDVIVLAVRWYLRFGLSTATAKSCWPTAESRSTTSWSTGGAAIHAAAGRRRPALPPRRRRPLAVDETYVKVAGRWRYGYRAIDQFGQVIDVYVSACRDANAARQLLEQALRTTSVAPTEVITDQAPMYPAVLEEPLPASWHRPDRSANNRVECDQGRLKARRRPMRGLKQDRSARVIISGHAFVQSLRRGQYELAVDGPVNRRLVVAFDELALAI